MEKCPLCLVGHKKNINPYITKDFVFSCLTRNAVKLILKYNGFNCFNVISYNDKPVKQDNYAFNFWGLDFINMDLNSKAYKSYYYSTCLQKNNFILLPLACMTSSNPRMTDISEIYQMFQEVDIIIY